MSPCRRGEWLFSWDMPVRESWASGYEASTERWMEKQVQRMEQADPACVAINHSARAPTTMRSRCECEDSLGRRPQEQPPHPP